MCPGYTALALPNRLLFLSILVISLLPAGREVMHFSSSWVVNFLALRLVELMGFEPTTF